MNKNNGIGLISRRDFLKASGLVVGTAAMRNLLFKGNRTSVFTRSVRQDPSKAEKTYYSYCKMCIVPHCGLRVSTKNDVVTGIEGDPQNPFNKGALCPRGQSNINNLYNPYRVKAPMKRTNPKKGMDVDPGWVEISWEEALGIIAGQLTEIQSTDPRGLIVLNGFGSMWDDFPLSRVVFPAAFGTPNTESTNGPLCPVHFPPLSIHGTFTSRIDMSRCEYLISLGTSIGGEFATASGDTRVLVDAIQRGMKLVYVNPRSNTDAAKGEYIPILPGTDLALLLAMGNVIIHEIKQMDEWFLKVRTNAPYLIKKDGYYARESGSKKPLVWDAIANKAVPFDQPDLKDVSLGGSFKVNGETLQPAFSLLAKHLEQYTPEFAEKITTIPAGKIRALTQEFVQKAHIGDTILLDGVPMPYRPVGVFAGRSVAAHRGGNYAMLMAEVVNMLVGAVDVPGSIIGESAGPFLKPGVDGTVEPDPRMVPQATEWMPKQFKFPPDHLDLLEFYPNRHCTPFVLWRAIVDPEKYYIKYSPKAMMVHGANPFTNDSNADEVEKAFLKIPFIFSIAYHFDEPTQFADILLPESSNLERLNYYVPAWTHKGVDDELRSLTAFNFKHPVTKPVYNSRDANDILMQLAVMIGIFPPVNAILNGMLRLPPKYQLDMDPPRPFTWPEVMDRILKSRFGDDKGIEYFIEHGSSWTAQTVPLPQSYNYFYFPQGATRHPIYFENLKMAGDDVASNCQKLGISIPGWKTEDYLAFFQPMPTWVPHPEHEAPKEYDLYAINWKIASRAFAMGGMAENPVVREMQALFEPDVDRVLMNPKTARAKGFSDGDEIAVITTEGFKVKGLLRTTELLHPKVVGFAGNFGHKAPLLGKDARRGINYNQLLSAADGKFDPSVGGIDSSPAVKVVRA